MTIKTFEKAYYEYVKELPLYKISTDLKINLGLNGTDYQSFEIGYVDKNDEAEKQNFISDNTLYYLGEGLVKISVHRTSWWWADKYRLQSPKQYDKEILLDVSNINSISY